MIRLIVMFFFFFQAEDGIRDLVRSRGLGDVYKRQVGDPAVVGATVGERDLGVGDLALPEQLDRRVEQRLSLIHI